jgi:spore coat polysaccharide biosynthesis protein SpsF
MECAIIIQARMSSLRLPGKVLLKHNEKSILDYQIERLRKSKKSSAIILSTSNEQSDDILVETAISNGIPYYRGDLNNVAKRFRETLQKFNLKYFARHCCDRPFYDTSLLDQAFTILTEQGYDIVSSIKSNTFPKGLTTEVMRTDSFLAAYNHILSDYDKEHVTSIFYKADSPFRVYTLSNNKDLSGINLCIDTQEDFLRFEKIMSVIHNSWPETPWQEIVKVYIEQGHKLCVA